jgi:Na+/melibiose symporter-like transporter
VYGLVYTLVRMAVNIIMTMQSFYLIKILEFESCDRYPSPLAVAITPLCSYIISIIFQIFLYKRMIKGLRNRFIPMALAILITIIGSAPLFFLDKNS